ncbi:MAG: hypothetical protein AAF610_15095 [Pseudomonadota bacterium]
MTRLILLVALILAGCSATPFKTVTNIDLYGERFVRLALALGQHDADYVDAYHGPEQWQRDAEATEESLNSIREAAEDAAVVLRAARPRSRRSEQRRLHLVKQFEALAFRARMLQGESFTFDEESLGLYDAVAPTHSAVYFQAALDELDATLNTVETDAESNGTLADRYQRYRTRFEVPAGRLDAVFRAAIAECAERTRAQVPLPEGESFRIEYVSDKSWSGYNWYQGGSQSLIQVNTDFPIHIDRAIDLACHEGYPGHHVYNTLVERELLKKQGWIEFSILPLFSPTGLIAEGSANYGIKMAFPGNQRVAFERDVLFELAGLDPNQAETYYAVQSVVERLSYAGNEAARRYLDGAFTAQQAANWLEQYALMAPDRARQRVQFFDQYRAYVINYNLGRDLVAAYVERSDEDLQQRWNRFERLLSSPVLPSQLVAE